MPGPSISPPSVPDAETWIGRVVDERYRITQVLGEGGMGTVFVAEHLRLGTPVALKVVHEQFIENEEVAARFAREAMASARIDHPHVASALDYGTLPDGQTYLVMQFVAGESLQASIEAGPTPWQRACHLGSQIADALMAAHAEEIIHRDLKPENVMVTPTEDGVGRAIVLDFGIARVPTDLEGTPSEAAPNQNLTKVGTVIGTPGYMAPQQAIGEPVDARADIYSLGVVLWEMVTGRALFPQEGLMAILTEQMGSPAPSLRSVAVDDDDVPLELDSLVSRMLAYAPEERPADAREVRDTLRALLGQRPSIPRAAISSTETVPEAKATKLAPSHKRGIAPAPGGASTPPAMTHRLSRTLTTFFTIPIVIAATLILLRLTTPAPLAEGRPHRPLVESIVVEWRALLRGEATLPPDIRDDVDALLHTESEELREAAAARLLGHGDTDLIPEYALAVAEVVGLDGRRCAPHRSKLSALADMRDERAIPALHALLREATGECVKTHLLATIAALEGFGEEPAAQAESPAPEEDPPADE